RIAIISAVRLAANTNRLGVSIGSQGSAAPVSPDAQPPARVATKAAVTAERRTPAVTDLGTLAVINANPASISPAQGTRGRNAKRRGFAPLFRRQCRIRRLHFEVHSKESRVLWRPGHNFHSPNGLAYIKICLYSSLQGPPS